MATGDSNDMVRCEKRYRSVNAENVTFAVPTQNRFAIPSGRGNGQKDRDYKRKKSMSRWEYGGRTRSRNTTFS
ncbi:hypothetical protein DPMN_050020 [Dreissena polymorpha]|uniref:Uncharacterized protein n=1 Tax=Dreissena polymorpha TaxID=45954 RepID=A0A9D4CH67_DREPO|nr:hypothetical protein DPMN_050020 [Dreissena polymorpha]